MRVRVFDSKRNLFFKSEVYAVINSGYYEKQLVYVPNEVGGYFKFFDYLDKTNDALPVLINTIISQRPDAWIFKRAKSVDEILIPYQNRLSENIRFFEYNGFPWLWENVETLTKLLTGKSVPIQGSIFEGKVYSDILQPSWRFIENQEDANLFMEEVCGFHDSVIKELHYISGAFVDPDNSMMPVADKRSVTMQIQSQQCRNFTLEFEGVTALNLRPATDNYTDDIYDATLIVQDEQIFFSDSFMERIDLAYEGTWVSAYSLKWKYDK